MDLPTDTPLPPNGDKGPGLLEFALAVAVPPEGVLRVRRPGIEEGKDYDYYFILSVCWT